MGVPQRVRPLLMVLLAAAALPSLAAEQLLPGLANTSGLADTRFESTVWLTNVSESETAVELGLIPAGPSVRRTLRAGETLRLDNPLATLFATTGAGTLRVRSVGEIVLRGVTANVADPGRTFGVALTAVDERALLLPGETGHALWVSHSRDPGTGFRTNVAVVLARPDSAARVTLLDDGGVVLGETLVESAEPASWQRSVAELVTDPEVPVGRLEVRVLRGAAAGYAAVVDNVTGDGLAVPLERADGAPDGWLVDGAARAAGRNGTHWQTDLRLFNPGSSGLTVAIEPIGFTAPAHHRRIPARALVEVTDLLASAFGLGDGYAGAVRLRADGLLLATARIRNVDPAGGPGSYGAWQRARRIPSELLGAGQSVTFTGLAHDERFRTNLAVLGEAATLVLRGAAGMPLASAVTADSGWRQRSLAEWFPEVAIPPDARVDLIAGPGTLDAYASVIDNATGDPVVEGARPFPTALCRAPPITSFRASVPSTVDGSVVTLTLTTADGSGALLEPGGQPIASGVAIPVMPPVTTTYRGVARAACGAESSAAVTVEVTPRPGSVMTELGSRQGVDAAGVIAWKGIAYAAPPLHDLRWRPPAPPSVGSAPADAFGSVCAQLAEDGSLAGSEDCLTLNVWSPSAHGARPMLFFIHGGGNVQGSSSEPLYDGTALARTQDAMVVTANYRLAALGTLVQPFVSAEAARGTSGNLGLFDLLAALRFIRRNAEAFGGDPERLTIFGESAGGVNVCALLASPLAGGLFQRAIIESGGCVATPQGAAQAFGDQIVSKSGCAAAEDTAACMRSLSLDTVLRAVPGEAGVVTSSGQAYGPVLDGFALKAAPLAALAGEHNRVPLIVGANSEETGLMAPAVESSAAYATLVYAQFGAVLGARVLAQYPASAFATPRQAYVAVTTDARFVCHARRIARAAAAGQEEPVFRYVFTHALASGAARAAGAFHGLELPFVFGTFQAYTPTAAELALSQAMGNAWRRFAAVGDPGGWPVYQSSLDPYLRFDTPISAEVGFRTSRCDFWDSLAP